MTKSDEGPWLEGRTRHVRVYLTEDEHALVRAAAAKADKSVSRFSVEAIVTAARHQEENEQPPPAQAKPAKAHKRKSS
jgi:hypothetical protein